MSSFDVSKMLYRLLGHRQAGGILPWRRPEEEPADSATPLTAELE